jgi:hypothetical protein
MASGVSEPACTEFYYQLQRDRIEIIRVFHQRLDIR